MTNQPIPNLGQQCRRFISRVIINLIYGTYQLVACQMLEPSLTPSTHYLLSF